MSNFKVLAIDDSSNNLFALEYVLKSLEEIELIKAQSGKEGLELLKREDINLVLVDIQMPGMNGFEFFNILKNEEDYKQIPIIFLTAYYVSDEFKNRGFKLGAFDYLTKPLDENRLINIVKLHQKLHHENCKNEHLQKQLEEAVALLNKSGIDFTIASDNSVE